MQNLVFNIKPSKQFLYIVVMIVLVTSIQLFSSSFSMLTKILFCCALFSYAAGIIYTQTKAAKVTQINYQHGHCQIEINHCLIAASLCGDSFVTRFVSVLRFKIPKRKFPINCLLLRDSLPQDDYRRLIVAVRCYR